MNERPACVEHTPAVHSVQRAAWASVGQWRHAERKSALQRPATRACRLASRAASSSVPPLCRPPVSLVGVSIRCLHRAASHRRRKSTRSFVVVAGLSLETSMTTAAEFAPRLITGPAPVGAGLIGRAAAMLREFGPYLAVELILPGGTLLALLIWLCRRHQNAATHGFGNSDGNLIAPLRRIASRLSPRPLRSFSRRLGPSRELDDNRARCVLRHTIEGCTQLSPCAAMVWLWQNSFVSIARVAHEFGIMGNASARVK